MRNSFILEAEEAKQQGFYNIAAVALATAFHNDSHENINPIIFFTDMQVRDIEEINEKTIEKVLRIFSFGKYWNEDEYMLALTFRVNWQLINDYFDFYGIDFNSQVKMEDLDDVLRSSTLDKKNYKCAFNSSILMLRNRKGEISDLFLKKIFQKLGP